MSLLHAEKVDKLVGLIESLTKDSANVTERETHILKRMRDGQDWHNVLNILDKLLFELKMDCQGGSRWLQFITKKEGQSDFKKEAPKRLRKQQDDTSRLEEAIQPVKELEK